MFFKIAVLKNNVMETLVLESPFNKVAGLKVCILLERRLQHSCLDVNIGKF